jgi:hypothetical protein
MYAKYLCDHQNSFWEKLFFGSPEKLRKWSYYTIIIKQRSILIFGWGVVKQPIAWTFWWATGWNTVVKRKLLVKICKKKDKKSSTIEKDQHFAFDKKIYKVIGISRLGILQRRKIFVMINMISTKNPSSVNDHEWSRVQSPDIMNFELSKKAPPQIEPLMQ